MRDRSSGFTLIELMIAVVILSVLVTLAVPSFQDMVANNRAASQANSLLQLITYGRSEAIRRNRVMTLCRSTSGTSCAGAGDWAQGIVLFVDTDNDGTVDTGEDIVLASVPFARGVQINTDPTTTTRLSYSARGIGNWAGSFAIKRGSLASDRYQRSVVVSTTGRARIEK